MKREFHCKTNEVGGIKALLLTPLNMSFEESRMLLSVGDIMTERKDDKVEFGNDIRYVKLIDDETKST